MPGNIPLPGHPLVGTDHVYRADLPPYDPDLDTSPGVLILGNGMPVTIKAVFQNWNGVAGLDILYVYCPATSMHTHVTPKDLGLGRLTETGVRVRLPIGVAFTDREAFGTLLRFERHPNDVRLAVVDIDGERFPARVPADSIEPDHGPY